MGLEMNVYKKDKNGNKELVHYMGHSYYFFHKYIENITGKDWHWEYQMPLEYAKDIAERCCEVLISYYNSDRNGRDKFLEKARELLPISSVAEDEEYDKVYIIVVSDTYETFSKLYRELTEEESIWIEFDY